MAGRLTQAAVEVLESPSGRAARLTQVVVEAVNQPSAPAARITQAVVEALVATPAIYSTVGATVRVLAGTNGAAGNPIAGQSGGTARVTGGTGGAVPTKAAGTSGGVVKITAGAGGALSGFVAGYGGGTVTVKGGISGAVLLDTARNVTVFIAGVDRSAWVKTGIRRSMTLSGGSRASCVFVISSKHSVYRPAVGDEVVIYEGTDRWFAGVVDETEEFAYSGTSGLLEITVKCADYGALLDRIIIGRHFEVWEGALASITVGQIILHFLEKYGVTFGGGDDPGVNLGIQNFNFITASECFNQICAAAGCSWFIDWWRRVWLVSATTGYAAAPFSISQNDDNWAEMRVRRSSARRVNRQGVRNSQNLKALWTDSFTTDGTERVWVPMAQLSDKPIVRVDGADQVVVSVDEQNTKPYDFIWQQFSVMHNLSKPLLPAGTVIAVSYPSPLSHVEWAEDAADIALNGAWEAVEEVKDAGSIAAMQAIAASLLARKKTVPVTATFRTDTKGLEPGMRQTYNTTSPLLNETLVIQSVESEEQGKKFFRHQVTAASAAVPSAVSVWQKLSTKDRQAQDRILERITFLLAETVEGYDNPGLTTGVKRAVRVAEKSGCARDCALYFNSAVPTTEEISIDVLQNGVSIFGTTKMVYPAGATTVQRAYEFKSDPLLVVKGDIFTVEIVTADPNAKDGTLELTVIG